MQYYLQELALLEDDSADFAACYPQVAGNLGLGSEGSTDPHVRQLIEAVAFIAARLKRQIDEVPGDIAYSLLRSLAPHLVDPLPSMSVARFFPTSDKLAPVGTAINSSMRLHASTASDECIFSAGAGGVKLWPFELDCFWANASSSSNPRRVVPGINDNNAFVMRVENPTKNMVQDAPGELTFFVSGALNRALAATEALQFGVTSVKMVALDGSWVVPLDRDQIEVMGFDPLHRLVPTPAKNSMQTGALTLESLNFPRRFCFWKVKGLKCPYPSSGFFIVFHVEQSWLGALDVVKQNIHLNCVPIINLFSRNSVALRLKGAQDEYHLSRGEGVRGKWDVFSMNRVRLIEGDSETEVSEFHSGLWDHANLNTHVFWQAVRRERMNSNLGHASMAVRFVGLNNPGIDREKFELAMFDMTCTNCEAAENLRAGQTLEISGWDGSYKAALEFVPTRYVPPLLPSSGAIGNILASLQWRSASTDGLTAAVQRYLTIHNRTHSALSMAAVSTLSNISRRIVAVPWTGFHGAVGMGMGCRYLIDFSSTKTAVEGRYLFAKLIKRILIQIHNLPAPLDVLTHDMHGKLIHVD